MYFCRLQNCKIPAVNPWELAALGCYRASRAHLFDAGRRGPLIDGAFRPEWNWNGADVLSFANQVSDYPALLANLEIFRSQSNQFGPPQASANQQRKNRPITFASDVVGRWLTE